MKWLKGLKLQAVDPHGDSALNESESKQESNHSGVIAVSVQFITKSPLHPSTQSFFLKMTP